MLNKRFLKESPVIWALVGMVIALVLLIINLVEAEWYKAILLAILMAWMFTCAQKDYTIWKLTK